MIQTLLGHLFNFMWQHPGVLPRTVMRHPGRRQGGYGFLALEAVGAYEGMKSNNAAQGAAGAEANSAEMNAQNATRDKRLSSNLYSEYNWYQQPLMAKYEKLSNEAVDPDVASRQAAADITKSTTGQLQDMRRQEADYGVNPNSGNAIAARANVNLNSAVAKAGAATAARSNAINQTLQRLSGGLSADSSLLGGAESFAGMSQSGFQGAGALQGNVAGLNAEQAAGWGQLAGYGVGQYMHTNYPPPQQPYPYTPPPAPAPAPAIPPN